MNYGIVGVELVIIGAMLGAIVSYKTPKRESFPLVDPTPDVVQLRRTEKVPLIAKTGVGQQKTMSRTNCAELCDQHGLCTSPEFYECLNQQKDRYGVSGKHRTAFDPYFRRTYYNQFTATW